MPKQPRNYRIGHYLKKALDASASVFALGLVKALTFFINKARIWRFEITYSAHLRIRSFHDNLVVKSPAYKKLTESSYALPVRNAVISAFLVSLLAFSVLPYVWPFLNLTNPGKAYAGSSNATWTTQSDFQSATTTSNIDTTTTSGSAQLAITPFTPQGTGVDGPLTIANGATYYPNTDYVADANNTDAVKKASGYRSNAVDAPMWQATNSVTHGSGTITFTGGTLPAGFAVGDEIIVVDLKGTSSVYTNVGLYEFKNITATTSTSISVSGLTNDYDGIRRAYPKGLANYTTFLSLNQ